MSSRLKQVVVGPALEAVLDAAAERPPNLSNEASPPQLAGASLGGLRRSFVTILVLMFSAPLPVAAQTRTSPRRNNAPAVSFRPFFLVKNEQFAASKTFDAVFGSQLLSPFWGGGLHIDLREGVFVEIAASRFSKTGERVFVSNGQVFPLGLPLKATITPFEVTGGYRVRLTPRFAPYAGAGVGRYAYSETSTFSDAGEDVEASHAGFIVMVGVEVRAHRWVGIGVDAQFTHVTGIIGADGASKELGDTDLGGTALRVKVLVGR